tara:strand:- start:25 stop:246 length:222 start_codon:yes stop_codon:yes gene_type:complete
VSKYKYCTCTFLEKQIGDIESNVASGLETRSVADYRIECLMLDDKFDKLKGKAIAELDKKYQTELEELQGGVQ